MSSESSQNWIAKNWKILAAVVVVTGVAVGAFYAFKSEPAQPSIAKKKKSKRKKSAKSASSGDVTPEVKSEPVKAEPIVSVEDQKEKEALEAKTLGNQLYSQKKYEEAIEQYTKAIELAPNAVFYCNRAACYSNLEQYDLAIADCTKAIEYDPKYLKAFHRRALAYEKVGNSRSALFEYTIVCALENFQNQASMAAPDRVLKQIATERAKELMEKKEAIIPSETFITAYLDSFRARPTDSSIVLGLEDSDESVTLLKQAFEAVADKKWSESLDFANQSLEADKFTDESIKAKAFNFRGTMYFLMGKINEAVSDLENSLLCDPENINTIIKRATLYMERGDVEKTIEQFQKAESIAPNHPDLYYHRGQVRFLTGDFSGAIDDYNKSVANEKPEESTVYAHIQLGVAKYKLGDIVGAEKKFREAKKSFPDSAEVWNYHGEILLDKQSYLEGNRELSLAEKAFDKAIEMEPNSPLPYINKAILYVQWKQDSKTAEELCRKAISVDALCDIAFTQLAQLLCLSNRLDEAVAVYEDAIKIARTEVELVNVLSCQEAALAQAHVLKTFPEIMASIRQD